MASYLGLERMDNEFAFSIALAGRGRRRNQALPDPMQELLISSSSPNTSALANSATAAAFTQASQYPPPSGVVSTASTGQATHADTHTDINGPINHVLVGNSTVGTTSAGHHLLDQPIKLSPTNRHILAPDKPRLHPADYMLFEGSTRHDDLPPAAHPIVLHSAMPTSVGRLPGLFTSQAPASRFQLTPTSASTPVYNMSSLPPVAHRFPAGLGLSEGKRTSSESSSLVFEIRDDANLTAGEEEGEEEEEEGEDGDEEDEDDEEEEEEEDEEEGVEDHEDGDEVNMDEDDGDEEDEAEDVGADEMGGRKRRGISVLMDEQYASFYRAPLTPSLSELNGITTGALVEATRTAHSTMSGTASTLVTSAIVNITPNNASNFSVGSGNTQTFSSPSPPLSSFSPCTSGAAAQLQANTTSTPTSTPTPIPMLPSQATTTSRSSSGSAGSLMIASSAGSAGGIATATVKMPSSPEPHEGLGNRISPTRHSQGNDCYHGTDLVTASKLYEHDVVRSLHCLSQPFHSSGLHVSPVPTGGFDHFHELGMLPSRQQGYRHQDQCYQHKHQHLRQRHDPADNNSVVSASSSCSRSSSTGLGLDPDEQEPERQSSGSGLRLDKLSPSKLDETEKDYYGLQETGFPASSLVSARAGHRECVKCGVLTASDWCPDGTGHFLCHACSFTRLYEAGLSGSALLYPSRRGYETNDTGDKTASLSADAAEAVVNASAVASLETGKLDDALFSPAGQTKASAEVDEVDSAAYTASVSGYRPPLTHVAFHHSPANQPQPQPQPQHQHQHQTYHQHQHQYQHAHRGQPSTNSEADLRFPHPPQGHGLRGDDRLPRQDHNPQQQMHLQAVARPPSARETPAPRAIGHPSYPAHFQPNHSHNHTHPQHHHQAPVQEMAPPQPQQQVELESPENARVSEEVYAYPLRPSGYMNHFAPTHPFYQPYMQTQAAAYPAYPNTGGMISSFPGYPSDRPAPHPLPMEEAFSGPLAEDRYRGDALQTNRLLSHSVCPEAAPPSSGLKTTSTGFAGATGTGGTTTTSAGLAYTCPSGGVGLVSMSTMAACAAAAVSAAAAAAAVGVTGSLVGVRKTASETGVIEDSAFPPPQLPPLPGVKTTSHQHICCPGAMERRPGGCDLAGDEASEAGRKSRLDSPFCQNLGPVRPRSATGNNRRQVSCFA